MENRQFFREEHHSKLVSELADRAQIDEAAAQRVLEVMHIDKLDENLRALHDVLSNKQAVNALGMSHSAAEDSLRAVSEENFSIDNLRVGIKPPDFSGVMV